MARKRKQRKTRATKGSTEKKHAILNEVMGLILLLTSVFLVISLATFEVENYPLFSQTAGVGQSVTTGIVGSFLAQYLVFALGKSAFSIPLLLFLWSCSFFAQRVPEKKFLKLVGFMIFMFASAGFLALWQYGEARFANGGFLGYYFAEIFETYFGSIGGYFISGFLLCLSFVLATEFLLFPLIKFIALAIWAGLTWIGHKIQDGVDAMGEMEWKLPQISMPRSERSLKAAAEPKKKSELVSILRKANMQAVKKKAKSERVEEENESTPSLFREKPPELKIKKYNAHLAPTSDEAAAEEHSRRKAMFDKFMKKKGAKVDEKEVKSQAAALKKEAAVDSVSEKKQASLSVPSPQENKKETPEVAEETPKKLAKPYTHPPATIFDLPKPPEVGEDDIKKNSQLLERTLADFGVEAKVVEVEQGPVITRYEILPAPGIKVNKITCLSDDLALVLKAPSIRFIAPIPGKSAIGIEVPNSKQATVTMRELMETDEYKKKKDEYALPLFLGKNANGSTLIADLATMPHLLVAGTTGSGKTVCINAIITGLICANSPKQLRFVMVDPKMVELSSYNALPHMLMPVVTDSKKAAMTLQAVVMEMEARYNMLAAVGVRNIKSFNEREPSEEPIMLGEKKVPDTMPYIVVVIDELADLMLVARDKVEATIQRLAQLSRAVGIHLVLATQKPSVDVITGVIKANLPARIAFQVTSKVDSRVILDIGGADKLIGKGDMLFNPPGAPKPYRAQCTFIQDKEINAVISHLRECDSPDYDTVITESAKPGAQSNLTMEKDELYDDAVRVVIDTQQASVSTLQRRLSLGYARAARIMDMMQAEGIVGPPRGAKPREILIGQEEAEEVSA